MLCYAVPCTPATTLSADAVRSLERGGCYSSEIFASEVEGSEPESIEVLGWKGRGDGIFKRRGVV